MELSHCTFQVPRELTDRALNIEFVGVVLFFGSRISFSNHTDFNQSQLSFLPEVGLSIIGIFSVLYGYNIPLSDESISSTEGHKISVTLTLPLFSDAVSRKKIFK